MSQAPSSPIRFTSGSAIAAESSAAAEVQRVYRQVLKRDADIAGLEHYREALEAGATDVKTIVRDLLQSAEWRVKFVDGCSIGDTVLALYDSALARAPDVDGWNQLTSWMPGNGWSAVIDGMLDGAEYEERFGTDLVPGEVRLSEAASG